MLLYKSCQPPQDDARLAIDSAQFLLEAPSFAELPIARISRESEPVPFLLVRAEAPLKIPI